MKRFSLIALFLVLCLAAGLLFSGDRLGTILDTSLRSGEMDLSSMGEERIERAILQEEEVAEYVPGQVLIRFKKTVTRRGPGSAAGGRAGRCG